VVYGVHDGSTNKVIFRRSTDRGLTFEPEISDNSGSGSFHRVASAGGGSVYVVWGYLTGLFFRASTDHGQSFGNVLNLNKNSGGCMEYNLACSGKNVYVVWDEIKRILTQKRLTRTSYRGFAEISASLSQKIYDLGIADYFDDAVLEKNILLPKKEYLNEVYDDVLGTDKFFLKCKKY
jgi:hypothetical protein